MKALIVLAALTASLAQGAGVATQSSLDGLSFDVYARSGGNPQIPQCQDGSIVINQPNQWCSTENIPTQNISVSECCGAYGQSVDRAVEASQPFCPSSGCDLSSNDRLEIALDMQSSGTIGACCTTCLCVGDPQCGLHKDGVFTEKIWITCDDRIPEGRKMCKHDKKRCEAMEDDYGNKCRWIKENAADVGKYGSPCQPSKKSPKSKMVMYHGKKGGSEVQLELTLGERSIIESLTIRQFSEQTLTVASLSAKDCFGNNARGRYIQQTDKPLDPQEYVEITDAEEVAQYASDVWTSNEGESGLFMVKKVSFPNAMEVQYNVLESTLGLNFAVRCTSSAMAPNEWSQQSLKDWTATIPRLDVLSVLVPSKSTVDEEVGGFCVTGEIEIVRDDQRRRLGERISPQSVSVPRELKLGSDLHDKCLEKWQPSEMDACSAVDQTCVTVRYSESVRSWCGACSYALQDTAEECVSKLKVGGQTAATTWRDYIAEMNQARQSPKQTRDDIAQFGYNAFFARGFAGQLESCISPTSAAKACGQLSDYSLRENVCVPGVSVEYFDDCSEGGDWKEAFFIPTSLPPCDGKLTIPGGSIYDRLFKHKIRFSQRSISADCFENTQCSSTPEFSVSFNFVQLANPAECITSESTCESMTETPTASPVPTPTASPVEDGTPPPVPEPEDPPRIWSSHVSWEISEEVRGHALSDSQGVLVFAQENKDGSYDMFDVNPHPLYEGYESYLCHSSLTLKNGVDEVTMNIVASVQKGERMENRTNFHIWNADTRSLIPMPEMSSLDGFVVESIECNGNMIFVGGTSKTRDALVHYFEIPEEITLPNRRRLDDTCTGITSSSNCNGPCTWQKGNCILLKCEKISGKDACDSVDHCFSYTKNGSPACTEKTIGTIRSCGSLSGNNPQAFYANALFTFKFSTSRSVVRLYVGSSGGPGDICSLQYKSQSTETLVGAKFARIDGQARTMLENLPSNTLYPTLVLVGRNRRNFEVYTLTVEKSKLVSSSNWAAEIPDSSSSVLSYDVRSVAGSGNPLSSEPLNLYVGYGTQKGLIVHRIQSSATVYVVKTNPSDFGVTESVVMYQTGGDIEIQAAGGELSSSRRLLASELKTPFLFKGFIRIFVLDEDDVQVDPPNVISLPIKSKACEYRAEPSQPVCVDGLLSLIGESEECEESCTAQLRPEKNDRNQVIAQVKYPFAMNGDKNELVDANAVLNLQFNVQSYPPCCRYCSCWGDPECLAFGKKPSEYLKWVVCDSRTTPDGEKCLSTEATCVNTVDHRNRTCEWRDRGAEKKPKLVSFYGHSCQPNWEVSGPAGMTMYKTIVNGKRMRIGLQMGERGVIQRLMVRLADVSFDRTFALDLSATKCFDKPRKGSTHPPGFNSSSSFPSGYFATSLPEGNPSGLNTYKMGPFTLQEEFLSDLSKTQTLSISEDLDFAISMEILCTRFKVGKKYGGARLRVNLFDARMEPGEQESGSGFCVSNSMDGHLPKDFDSWIPEDSFLALPDIPQLESPELKGACFDQVPEDIRICTGIIGKPCQKAEVLRRATAWCQDLGTSSCTKDVLSKGTVNVRNWVKDFCKTKSRCLSNIFKSDVKTCVNDIINDSADAFKKLEVCQNVVYSKPCANSASDYPSAAPDSCTQGMSIQTSSDGAAWKTEFFVPDSNMPCNGVLTVSAEEMPNLFSQYVRFLRQDIDYITCRSVRPESSCDSRPRFSVNYTYSAQSCDLAHIETTIDSFSLP